MVGVRFRVRVRVMVRVRFSVALGLMSRMSVDFWLVC